MSTEPAIKASVFIERIRERRFDELEEVNVHGDLSLRGVRLDYPIRAMHVTFWGRVDFGDASAAGTVNLSGCTFRRTVSFSGAKIDGSLVLRDICVLALEEHDGKTEALSLAGARVKGDCDLTGAVTGTPVDATALRVEGDLDMLAAEIEGHINLSNASVDGNISIGVQQLNLGAPRPVYVPGFVKGDLIAVNSSIGGNVAMHAPKIDGNVRFDTANVSGSIFCHSVGNERPVIGGDLDLSAIQVRGHTQLSGAVIRGEMKLLSGDIGPLSLAPDLLSEPQSGFFPCEIGRLFMSNSVVRGWVHLNFIQVTGAVFTGGDRGIFLTESEIRSSFRLWDERVFERIVKGTGRNPPDPWDVGAAIVGDLNLSGTTILGECNLTLAKIDGKVKLTDVRIVRDLRARCAAQRGYTKKLADAPLPTRQSNRFTCHHLNFEHMSCEGDVDLSGLSLTASHQDVQSVDSLGSINGRYAIVKGHLDIANLKARNLDASCADIPGVLDLSHSEITHFRGTAHSFCQSKSVDSKLDRLVLTKAKIGKLEIPQIDGIAVNGFPRPMNLSDVDVGTWELGSLDEDRYRPFNDLLSNDLDFRRSTYSAIEAFLRNTGHEEEANKVYVSMQKTAQSQRWRDFFQYFSHNPWRASGGLIAFVLIGIVILGTGVFHWGVTLALLLIGSLILYPLRVAVGHVLLYWPFRFFMGFGTNLRVFFLLIVLLAAALYPMYRDGRNFEPTLAYLATEPRMFRSTSPEDSWTAWDAAALMWRYHVPVIPITARDEWEPRDNAAYGHPVGVGYDYSWFDWLCNMSRWLADDDETPRTECRTVLKIGSASPEDVTTTAYLLNWALWPLLLAFLLRRLLR